MPDWLLILGMICAGWVAIFCFADLVNELHRMRDRDRARRALRERQDD